MTADPDATPSRTWFARIGLVLILVLSAAMRVALATHGGQFYWTDEARYATAQAAIAKFLAGDWHEGMEQLFAHADHLLFKVLGLIPALLEKVAGENPCVPAIFFGMFSVGVVFLVGRLVRAQGGSVGEALGASYLAAACNSFFYYSRHVFPYDLALCLFLLAGLQAFSSRAAPRFSAGVLAGSGFATYNGYWWGGGVVLCLAFFSWEESLRSRLVGVGLVLAGLLAPLLAIVAIGAALGHNLVISYIEFSRTVTGDMGIAWRFVPEYFWRSERYLTLFFALAVVAALATWRSGALERRTKLWLAGGLLFYAGMIAWCDGFKHFTVFARHARPLAIFLCLVGGWFLARLAGHGRRGQMACGVAIAAICVQAACNMRAPFQLVFPPEFESAAACAITHDEQRNYGLHRIVPGGFVESPGTPVPPFRVIYRAAHPLEFQPYAFEGYSYAVRAAFASRDISMRAVRLLPEAPAGRPQLSRAPGFWGAYPGAIRLEVIFEPTAARTQPLIVAGHTGAGDQLFVEILGPDRLRLGFDHWAVSATYSPAIACDLAQPHVITCSFGALYPDLADKHFQQNPAWASLKHDLLVTFDGQPVISGKLESHPASPESIMLFLNRIGFSTSASEFGGRLLSASAVPPAELLAGSGPPP